MHLLITMAVVLAAVAASSVDISPLINGVVVPLLTPILAAGALWLGYRVQSFFHLHVLDGRRALLESAINNGIALAAAKLQGPLNVNVPAHVAAVVDYANKTVPDTLKKLGVDPGQLGQRVAAEIAKAGGVPAS